MPRLSTLSPHAIVALTLVVLMSASSSHAGRPGRVVVFEDFENPADVGTVERLVIGPKSASATLDGGEIAVRNKGHFYQSFPHAWIFDSGVNGTIDWKKPASKVSFFANLEGGVGYVYLLGRRDKVLKRFSIRQEERPTEFRFESQSGVHRALIVHLGSIIAIDDLEYTVE